MSMATRRNVQSDKAYEAAESPRHITPASPATHSNITPAVPLYESAQHAGNLKQNAYMFVRSIVFKLLTFTFLMVTLPITSYFVSRDYIYSGNSTWAGATAAIMANVVLFGYIIVAVLEDQGDDPGGIAKPKPKDSKGE